MTDTNPYPTVDSKLDLPALEERMLAQWDAEGAFHASIEARPETDEYVFYDGPPFANGLPHHGHLLTGYIKDVVPRYQTMRGHRVDRRFGWDCHGLPAEMGAEQELDVSGRRAISEYGIAKFNEYCRSSVMRYTSEWERYVTRQARWVDFENDYKTMDLPYMESVIWAFKQLWDKGLIYRANRVMPYSWGAETPLSNFEIRLDDATRPRQDPALTVAFTLDPADGDPGPLRILAWTTTPWTLPSNLALAVGPDIDYSIVRSGDGDLLVLGAAAVDKYARELGEYEIIATMPGHELVGRTYTPLFPYFADHDAFRVLQADFVDTAEGTGVVHMAPGFGEDDQAVCEANGIAMVVPVDHEGKFTAEVADWAGVNVFDANPLIIAHLKEHDVVVRHETYDHNYPHCWRTDTPIIYRAMPSWYVEVTAFRDRMVELNQQINWVPSNVRDGRFGKWLEGARDWSISRNRFWGSPIPVWESDDPNYPRIDVYGSLDELEADFGVRPDDLHLPYIDELVRPNPDDPTGKSMMRRVPEVFDCWFESGSMPYAQVHYPFENKEWFESHFPADFIVEYVNQTRGWFYTLHVLSTALFDRPPFLNAICHGVLLAEDGAKLSKKLRNFTDPDEIFNTVGADALRWYMMSSPIVRGGDLRISDREIRDVTRLIINPVWNAYSFFTLYANADGFRAEYDTSSEDVLDRYILAKTAELVASVTEAMDRYDLPGATATAQAFTDALNNWYIRRSRDRFWAPAAEAAPGDKQAAYNTLYTVLVTMTRTLAPLLPMVTDEIHRGLCGGDSVHLADWPDLRALPTDAELVAAMDRVRDVCSASLNLREDHGIGVRIPLSQLTVAGQDTQAMAPFSDLIRDEINVKDVQLSDDLDVYASRVLKPHGRVLGPRLGKQMQAVLGAARAGEWEAGEDGSVVVAGETLTGDEFELALEPKGDDAVGGLTGGDGVVVLDLELTPELVNEGHARQLQRYIQDARKASGLEVTDRIVLTIDADDEIQGWLAPHVDHLASQVLATQLSFGPTEGESFTAELDGRELAFALRTA
ncbi:MAG: isoleucine--tRNA ligase [Actinomycetota bacterium]